jgi:hypothetical protein
VVGSPSVTIDLGAKQSKRAYLYKLKVPPDYEFTKFNITSKLSVESLNISTSLSTIVTVKVNASAINKTLPKNETTKKNMTAANGSSGTGTKTDTTKEDNFLKKIFKSIESFFSKIFTGK